MASEGDGLVVASRTAAAEVGNGTPPWRHATCRETRLRDPTCRRPLRRPRIFQAPLRARERGGRAPARSAAAGKLPTVDEPGRQLLGSRRSLSAAPMIDGTLG